MSLGWDLARRIQIKLGMTQAELVQRAGLSRSTIQFWRSGAKLPSSRALKKLAPISPAEFADELSREIQAAVKRESERQSRDRHEAVYPSIPLYLKRAIEKAAREHGLDTSYILPEVIAVWLRAQSRGATGKHVEKITKEAHKRAHPRS